MSTISAEQVLAIGRSRDAAKGIEVGSYWQNIHTGDVVQVTRVGPCDILGGRWRVWNDGKLEQEWPSNGSDPDDWRRAWRRVDQPTGDTAPKERMREMERRANAELLGRVPLEEGENVLGSPRLVLEAAGVPALLAELALLRQAEADHEYLRDRGDCVIYRDEYEDLRAKAAENKQQRDELERLRGALDERQAAIDRAMSLMHSSQYVGGPSEREMWLGITEALEPLATEHQGEAPPETPEGETDA